MEERPSRSELEKQKEVVVNELKYKGLYDDLRKQHLSRVEGDVSSGLVNCLFYCHL